MTCKCNFNQRMVGDGCEICNPAQALEYARDRVAELEAECAAQERITESLNASWHSKCLRLETENARLRARLATARELLTRYRTQTPIGHQPHMICGDVDAWLAGED